MCNMWNMQYYVIWWVFFLISHRLTIPIQIQTNARIQSNALNKTKPEKLRGSKWNMEFLFTFDLWKWKRTTLMMFVSISCETGYYVHMNVVHHRYHISKRVCVFFFSLDWHFSIPYQPNVHVSVDGIWLHPTVRLEKRSTISRLKIAVFSHSFNLYSINISISTPIHIILCWPDANF